MTTSNRHWISTDTYLTHLDISDQIRENVLVKQYYCDVDIAHLISYNEELAHKLSTEPAEITPLVRSERLGRFSYSAKNVLNVPNSLRQL